MLAVNITGAASFKTNVYSAVADEYTVVQPESSALYILCLPLSLSSLMKLYKETSNDKERSNGVGNLDMDASSSLHS